MAEDTKIEWCDHTFQPWRGCTKVSPGCQHCYAETMSRRNPAVLGVWGPQGTRVVASETQWKLPLKWNAVAARDGVRRRVFCASLADVFEDWVGPMVNACEVNLLTDRLGAWREESENVTGRDWLPLTMDDVRLRLFETIHRTPCLDWLLLTKRPENVVPTLKRLRDAGLVSSDHFPWPNVWLGVSVEDQQRADERIPALIQIPAAVRFLSCEPLLGPIHLMPTWTATRQPCPDGMAGCEVLHLGPPSPLHWIIVGGESGPQARPCHVEWVRSLVRQCQAVGVACFVKQLGGRVMVSRFDSLPWSARRLNGPDAVPDGAVFRFYDRKGGDPTEWPEDLRVRQFPR